MKTQRLTKAALARQLGPSRSTITETLARPGAPLPDHTGRYDPEEVRHWIDQTAPRASLATRPGGAVHWITYHVEVIAPALQRDFARTLAGKSAKEIDRLIYERIAACHTEALRRWPQYAP